jgi:hypothetical protein
MADESNERCEPSDRIDDVERERQKRRDFIRFVREREERKPRYYVGEEEQRERRMVNHDRRAAERRDQCEDEAVRAWATQQACIDDLKRAETVRRTGVASIATEPELVEDFNWEWVSKFVDWRLAQERRHFEARLEEMNCALVDNARAVAQAFDAVDGALDRAAQKGSKQLTGALERITKQLSENQHQIMRAVNRVGEGKPVGERSEKREEPKSAPAKIH